LVIISRIFLQLGIIQVLSNESNDVFGISWKKFWPGFIVVVMTMYFGCVVGYFVDDKKGNELIYLSYVITFPLHLYYYVVQFFDINVNKQEHLAKKEKSLEENLEAFNKRVIMCQVNFLILHGKLNKADVILNEPKLITDYPIFENDKEFKNDIEELKDLFLEGQCNDGGVIQLTLNELMT